MVCLRVMARRCGLMGRNSVSIAQKSRKMLRRRRGLLPALQLLVARGVVLLGRDVKLVAGLAVPQGAGLIFRRGNHWPALPTSDAPTRLFSASSSKIYGPAVDRTQAPTHLDGVEDAVHSILQRHHQFVDQAHHNPSRNILDLPPQQREAVGVATRLQKRLQGLETNGDCRRCWLQRAHCVCERCVPLEGEGGRGIPKVDRLFLLTHHKEIGLVVDTAKLILASFPQTARLVVSGLGREHQPALGEMLDAASDAARGDDGKKCLILFPTDDARTFEEIETEICKGDASKDAAAIETADSAGWDVIVIDGTWSQARKLHAKYFGESKGNLRRVQLSDDAVRALDGAEGGAALEDVAGESDGNVGHQLRRHPIKWREISTLEATRLLLVDMHPDGDFAGQSEAMARYHEIGNEAARRQLGPPRVR
ncbi:hypothetical protein ACHAXT_001611 [Thalassiosira profunda]